MKAAHQYFLMATTSKKLSALQLTKSYANWNQQKYWILPKKQGTQPLKMELERKDLTIIRTKNPNHNKQTNKIKPRTGLLPTLN